MENLRILHAIPYLKTLSFELRAGDYIAGSLFLKDYEFQELLDFFIKEEDYEKCALLVKKRNDLRRI